MPFKNNQKNIQVWRNFQWSSKGTQAIKLQDCNFFSFIGWMWDRNMNKPEIKYWKQISFSHWHQFIQNFNLVVQIVMFVLKIDKTMSNFLLNRIGKIRMTFPDGFLLYIPVCGHCLPVLFYIICEYITEYSFKPIISLNVSLCSMIFCYSRNLLSKVLSVAG